MKIEQLNNALLLWGPLDQAALHYLKSTKRMVILPEQRPFCAGLLHTVPLLRKHAMDFVYCTDNMLGILFFKHAIGEVFLAYTKEDAQGITTVSGSLYACLLAAMHGVKIRLHKAGVLDYNASDADASTFFGTSLLKDGATVPATEEKIEWKEMGAYEKNE